MPINTLTHEGNAMENTQVMIENTLVEKNRDNDWAATTDFHMFEQGQEQFFLRIETTKDYNGMLVTTAKAYSKDGSGFISHRYPNDYKHVLTSTKARVTEKAVRTQHEAALTNIQDVFATAMAHYGKA